MPLLKGDDICSRIHFTGGSFSGMYCSYCKILAEGVLLLVIKFIIFVFIVIPIYVSVQSGDQ